MTEVILFGVRGRIRTRQRGRTQPNIIISQKRGHSRKPDELYEVIEECSYGPYLEMFARFKRPGWMQWGDQIQLNGEHLLSHPTYRGASDSKKRRPKTDETLSLYE